MCGLVGIAGHLQLADEDTMKFMLLADYFRGPDATGLAAIRSNGDAVISKISSDPIDLMLMSSFKTALNGYNSRAFIGHNRAATRGGNVTVNAHPFHFDHIVGAHNGTLDTASHKALEDAVGEKYEVDSMALFAAIAAFGIEKAIKLCNEGKTDREGAWALTWYDQKEGTLNFLRNKHRPLYYALASHNTDEKIDRLFWSSEWWMMREAMTASKAKYVQFTEKQDGGNIGFFNFKEDVHYKFDLQALNDGAKSPPKPKVKTIKGKEPALASTTHPTHTWPTTKKHFGQNGTHTTVRDNVTPLNTKRDVIMLEGTFVKPYADVISFEQFKSFCSKNECNYCGGEVNYGDLGLTIVERDNLVLCRKCSGFAADVVKPPVRIYAQEATIARICK